VSFFSGQFSPFFDKELGETFGFFFLVQIQLTLVIFRKKKTQFFMVKIKKEALILIWFKESVYFNFCY
jgi:hypothetical protein